MIEHLAWQLCSVLGHLSNTLRVLACHPSPTAELDTQYKQGVATSTVQQVEKEIERLALGAPLLLKAQLLYKSLMDNRRFTAELLERDLRAIQTDITIELIQRKFAYLPPPNDKYFEQDKLFGEAVY